MTSGSRKINASCLPVFAENWGHDAEPGGQNFSWGGHLLPT